MTSFELKIWRRGMGWDQERAAEELGVGIATYKRYEKAGSLKRTVILATRALSLEAMMPELQNQVAPAVKTRLKTLTNK